METISLPQHVIDTHVEVVNWPPHRDQLHLRLGRLADLPVLEAEITPITNPVAAEQGAEVYADIMGITAQSEMIAGFFGIASAELGEEVGEDRIWEQVFYSQLSELKKPDSTYDKQALAVNILVGNLFATYDLEREQAAAVLDNRMWSVSLARQGLAVMTAAREVNGLCVVTGDAERPYASIVEQTQGHEGLFMATDKSVDLATVNMPVHELANATPWHQAQFVSTMVNHDNFTSVNRNLAFINDKATLCRQLLEAGTMKPSILENTELSEVINNKAVIDYAMIHSRNPMYTADISRLDADEQAELFDRMMAQDPNLTVDCLSDTRGFTELPEDSLRQLIDKGYFRQHNYLSIRAFKNLSAGMLDAVLEAGLSESKICEALSNFQLDERKLFYSDVAGLMFKVTGMFENPDQFDFVPRDEFLQLARDKFSLSDVAASIGKYTDGTDTALLSELIEEGNGTNVADNLGNMPHVDVEWFVARVTDKNDFGALLSCLPYTDTINQIELFRAILPHEMAEVILQFDLKKFTELDREYVLAQLVEARLFMVIATSKDYFDTQTEASLTELLLGCPEGAIALAENLHNFSNLNKELLVDTLAAHKSLNTLAGIADICVREGINAEKIFDILTADTEALAQTFSSFGSEFAEAVGVEKLFYVLIASGKLDRASWCLKKYDNPEMHNRFFEKCIEARDRHALNFNLKNLHIDEKLIAQRCCEAGWEDPLIDWTNGNDPYWMRLSNGDPANFDDIPVETLLSWGASAMILCEPYKYPKIDRQELFDNIVQRGEDALLEKVLYHPSIKSAPASVANYLLDTDRFYVIARKKELFDPSILSVDFLERYLSNGHTAVELYEYSGQKIDWMERGLATFGREVAPELLLAVKELETSSDRPLPAQFGELGVSQRGHLGVEQLKQAFSLLRNNLTFGINSQDELQSFVALTTSNDIAKSVAKQLTRYTDSQWGSHGEDEWNRIMNDHLEASMRTRPLPGTYVPSREYVVRTMDAKEFDPSKMDQDAVDKFTALRQSVDLALSIANAPARHRYGMVFAGARELLDSESDRLTVLRENLVAQNKQKAIENIDRQIAALDTVHRMDAQSLVRMTRDNFGQLSSLRIKGLEHNIRSGAYARAILRSPQSREIAQSLQGTSATFENLVAMNDFVEHLVNNEVYGDYFTNDESRKAFSKISDTTALRKQIVKTQAGQSTGQSSLQFVPSRGPLLELSGHLGDACWASKYKSIAEEFPNISALAYLRNPGKATERLVGAGLLIETVDQATGEEIVVLRGINPIENYINGVKVDDFFTSLIDYAKKIAGDKRVAVVIDGGPGQAATNRPILHAYLEAQADLIKADATPLKLSGDATFNGYEPSANVYPPHPAYYVA